MKKIAISFSITLALIPIAYLVAKSFWRGEVMSTNRVCKKWGETTLNIKHFKKAENDMPTRAKMACSLLKQQKNFIGKDRWKIREILGDYDGHYFSGMFPTYMIESARITKKDESWQIVFLIDRNEKISKIIVHKNCCD